MKCTNLDCPDCWGKSWLEEEEIDGQQWKYLILLVIVAVSIAVFFVQGGACRPEL